MVNREYITFARLPLTVRQSGVLSDRIFGFDEIVSYVGQCIILCRGDLMYTGTPSGVGPLSADDLLEKFWENKKCWKSSSMDH